MKVCHRLGVRIISGAEYLFVVSWAETEEEAPQLTVEEEQHTVILMRGLCIFRRRMK